MEIFSDDDVEIQEYQLQIDRLEIGPSARRRGPLPVTPLWKDYPLVPNQYLTASSQSASQAGSGYNLGVPLNSPTSYLPSHNYRSSSVASLFGGNGRKTLLSPPRLESGPVFPPSGYRQTTYGSHLNGHRMYDTLYSGQRASDPFHFFSGPISRTSSQSSGFVESQQSLTPPLQPEMAYKSPSIYSEPYGSESVQSSFIQRPTSYPSATWRPASSSPAGIFGSVKPRRPRNLMAGSKTCSRFGPTRSSRTSSIYSDDEEEDDQSFVTSLTSHSVSSRSQDVPASIRHRKLSSFPKNTEKENLVVVTTSSVNWKKLMLGLSVFLNIFLLLWIFSDRLFEFEKLNAFRILVEKWYQYLYEAFNVNHNSTASQFQNTLLLDYTEDFIN